MRLSSRSFFPGFVTVAAAAAVVVACGSSADESAARDTNGNDPSSSGGANGFGGSSGGSSGSSGFDAGDPYANDPAPKWCGPSGQPAPKAVGGTPECPDDKNKPGCPCDKLGEKRECFTGLRVHRNHGVCKDGQTTCVRKNENENAWGACEGEVLPEPGATKGKEACKCFSVGQWKIDNLSPCFVDWGSGPYGVSTVVDATGDSKCPDIPEGSSPPPKAPTSPWSKNTLTADCAGHFKLCYELKAGVFENPSASDCSLAKVCVEADYLKENVEQAFPDLKGWATTTTTCAAKWESIGGYGEMSVVGESVLCDAVDDGAGNAFVFNRVKYCPSTCTAGSTAPECANCQAGGSGTF
jgi:hypothetical protein